MVELCLLLRPHSLQTILSRVGRHVLGEVQVVRNLYLPSGSTRAPSAGPGKLLDPRFKATSRQQNRPVISPGVNLSKPMSDCVRRQYEHQKQHFKGAQFHSLDVVCPGEYACMFAISVENAHAKLQKWLREPPLPVQPVLAHITETATNLLVHHCLLFAGFWP